MRNSNTVIEIRALSPEQEATKSMVVAKMRTLEEVKFRRKNAKDRLEEMFMENEEYKNLLKTKKEERERLKSIKENMLKKPEIFEIKKTIEELNQEIKTTKADISDYLVMFEQATGQMSFIDPNGDTVEIERSAKPRIIRSNKR